MSNTRFGQELESASKMASETETKLRGEWGAAYDAKIDGTQQMINKFFKGKELHPAFNTLANDKGFVEAMAEIASQFSEAQGGGTTKYTLTPAEAQAELNEMISDSSGPLFDDMDPRHDEAVRRKIELTQMAYTG